MATNNVNVKPMVYTLDYIAKSFVKYYFDILVNKPQDAFKFFLPDASFIHAENSLDVLSVFGHDNIRAITSRLANRGVNYEFNIDNTVAQPIQGDSSRIHVLVTGKQITPGYVPRPFVQTFILVGKTTTAFFLSNSVFRLLGEATVQGYENSGILFGSAYLPQVQQHQQPAFISVQGHGYQGSLINSTPSPTLMQQQTINQHQVHHALQHHEQPLAVLPPSTNNITIQLPTVSNNATPIDINSLISSANTSSANLQSAVVEEQQVEDVAVEEEVVEQEVSVEENNGIEEQSPVNEHQDSAATDAEQADDERSAGNEAEAAASAEEDEQEDAAEPEDVQVVEDKTPKSYLDILRKQAAAPQTAQTKVHRRPQQTKAAPVNNTQAKPVPVEQTETVPLESAAVNNNTSADEANNTEKTATAVKKAKGPVFPVHVKNLPENPTVPELLKLFSVFGKVARVDLPEHHLFCFVKFTTSEAMDKALEANQTLDYRGQKLKIEHRIPTKTEGNIANVNNKGINGPKFRNNRPNANKDSVEETGVKQQSVKPFPRERKEGFKTKKPVAETPK